MTEDGIKYKLVRSKRKSLTITISDGEVIVKAPKSMSTRHIEDFIAQKTDWIRKKLAEYDKKAGFLAPVMAYTHALIGGELCEIALSDDCKRVKYESGILRVPSKYGSAGVTRAVSAWYRRTANEYLAHMLEACSIESELNYKSFALTNARTKWGSCDGECNIRLNWRLIMLDEELVRYVIFHELSHTRFHNHSAAFWAEVAKHYPAVKAAKKEMKTYSVLTSLYR